MNSVRFVLPLALALGTGSAVAEGPLQGNEVFDFHASLSRAEVHAQAVQAYRADDIARGEMGQPVRDTMAVHRSRAELRRETLLAQREGQIARGEILSAKAGA